ncbi:MAG: hypothetical protein COY80_03560 [Candidatus Pacebacteria bacterium CG_4_10_14_0_8_um_filter_42_14]|nr:MAG: hypothetical protein COY80_03560 [Candidatus Pacebacteria bacterium CG_4_10_14_0_8_um_filter_42_14]
MREHPIPQDITGYRFHIVGSMTLKQFGELALGAILAFFIYSTNLFAIIKWPLMVLAFGGGALAAFVPIQERPIDHWLVTFYKVLYKPTKFFWRRVPKIPDPFLFKQGKNVQPQEAEVDLSPIRRERIKEYLVSTQYSEGISDRTPAEESQLNNISALFASSKTRPLETPHINVVQKPNLSTRVRGIRQDPSLRQVFTVFSNSGAAVPQQESLDIKSLKHSNTYSQKKSHLTTEQVAQNIEIPETEAIVVHKDDEDDDAAVVGQQSLGEHVFISDQNQYVAQSSTTSAATLNPDLPFPEKPTTPNKLVGMVLSKDNELIPDAIVEIRTPEGKIERAVKTNALGQFFVTTPMKDGSYVIQAEKDGQEFPSQTITLGGSLVDPIEIRNTT